MAIDIVNGNSYNHSLLVSATLKELFRSFPTMAEFANKMYNGIWDGTGKDYSPGTVYTINLPTYPDISWGMSVAPTAKLARFETINIDTSSNPLTSGYFNACRQIDQTAEQLYLINKEEWTKQFVKPIFDVMYDTQNKFLTRQLRNSACYAVLPRVVNDRGQGNEALGRFLVGDGAMFNRARDVMQALRMYKPTDFVFCMNSRVYYDIIGSTMGYNTNTVPQSPTYQNRYINTLNERAFVEGKLNKIQDLYIYHTPAIPYFTSGVEDYVGIAGVTATGNAAFTATNGVAAPGLASMSILGYSLSSAAPGFNVTTAGTTVTAPFIPTPEAKAYLWLRMKATFPTGTVKLVYNPGDVLVIGTFDTTQGSDLSLPTRACSPIDKSPLRERVTLNVACIAPIVVTITVTTAGVNDIWFCIPVNQEPAGNYVIGNSPYTIAATENRRLVYKNNTQILSAQTGSTLYVDPPVYRLETAAYGPIPASITFFACYAPTTPQAFYTGSETSLAFTHIGSHERIFGFPKMGLNFVNPSLSKLAGADNTESYDEEAKTHILSMMQGSITAGNNIFRVSSLWGSGGVSDAIVQIPYYSGQ